ncbi:MAG: SCO family protein [Pseudomonadales bacterium]|nr:SCO family protein [Pseudomonadales bacterium]
MSEAQQSGIRKTVIACAIFISLVLLALINNINRPVILSNEMLREQGTFVLPRPREIASIELVDHNGELFSLENIKGVWSFLYFGFTSCPDICPVTLAVLAEVERNLRQAEDAKLYEGYQVVLITVDPDRDDIETLKQYVSNFSKRFLGVTGDNLEIASLAQQLNVAYGKVPDSTNPESYQVEHSGNIVLVNPRGHYHGFIKIPHSSQQIIDSYRTLSANF